MLPGKEKLIPLLAMTVLLVGAFSSVYVHATQIEEASDGNTITINGQLYSIDDLFSKIKQKTIETDDGKKQGIALDELIIYTGVGCPTCHEYKIVSKDKYQQTVTWEDMQLGVLTNDNRVFFPNLAHAFWIYDIVKIEVN